MEKDNLLREDLFYCLSVIRVTLPPLRECKNAVADLEHLPKAIRPKEARGGSLSTLAPTALSLQDVKKAAGDAAERKFLIEALQETGEVAELARRINIIRPHLQTLLKRRGIRSRDFRPTDSAFTTRTPVHRPYGRDTLSKNK